MTEVHLTLVELQSLPEIGNGMPCIHDKVRLHICLKHKHSYNYKHRLYVEVYVEVLCTAA